MVIGIKNFRGHEQRTRKLAFFVSDGISWTCATADRTKHHTQAIAIDACTAGAGE